MGDVKTCRICLIMDVKMFDLRWHPLETFYFESLTGNNPLSDTNMPPYACYECATIMKKSYNFQQKCQRTQATLYEVIDNIGKITSEEIKKIDRKTLELSTTLSYKYITEESIIDVQYDESQVKLEPANEEISVQETNLEIKEEDDDFNGFGEDFVSSDDDEPLSHHKEKKVQEKKKTKKEKKDDVDVTAEIPNVQESEETSQLPPEITQLVHPKKRGRPRKKAVKKVEKEKPKRKIAHLPCNDELADMEQYITVISLSVEEQIEEINKRKQSSNYQNSPYQCELCYKGFIDTHAWEHHVGKHSPSTGDIECPICKFRFKTKRALQKHASNHEKKYACKSCPYVSTNTTQAKQHQGWHKGVTYKCKYCDDIFTVWTSYMSHVRIKHPSEFICGVCGYSFISKLGLAMHKTMMHKDVIEKLEDIKEEDGPYCAECDVKFISTEAYKRHMVMSVKHTRTTDSIKGCRTCGEQFKNSEELRLHHRKEHARKRPKNYGKKPTNTAWPTQCQHCSEEIANAREYWTHFRRVHPDKNYPIQKNYVCDICGKSFRGNAFLVYHKRTHFEERAYKCGQCDKAFYNRTNLQVHEKTHSDTRPYPCTVCYKAFKCKGALTRHFRSHTGLKPYECEVCGKAFSQSNSRKLHVRTVHLKQPAPYVSRSRQERRNKLAKEQTTNHFIY